MSQHRPKMVSTVANLEKLELRRLKSKVERLVSALEEALEVESAESFDSFVPAVDLCENSECIMICIELPGVSHEDIEIAVSAKDIVIEGEMKHSVNTDKALSHFCCERQYGRFKRRIPLRWAININDTKAELRDGLLKIRLPKLIDRRGKSVKIAIEWDDSADE